MPVGVMSTTTTTAAEEKHDASGKRSIRDGQDIDEVITSSESGEEMVENGEEVRPHISFKTKMAVLVRKIFDFCSTYFLEFRYFMLEHCVLI